MKTRSEIIEQLKLLQEKIGSLDEELDKATNQFSFGIMNDQRMAFRSKQETLEWMLS